MGDQLRLGAPVGTGTGDAERVPAAVGTVPGVDAPPLCCNARLAAAPPGAGGALARTLGGHRFGDSGAVCRSGECRADLATDSRVAFASLSRTITRARGNYVVPAHGAVSGAA